MAIHVSLITIIVPINGRIGMITEEYERLPNYKIVQLDVGSLSPDNSTILSFDIHQLTGLWRRRMA